MNDTPLIAHLEASGARRIDVATALGVNKSTVTRWFQRGIPAGRVLDVERQTGISRHILRPDIYGPAPQEGARP